MAKRKDVIIKTKYESKEDCIENCRDIKSKTVMAMSLNRKISGTMTTGGQFVLSSRSKGAAMFEFKGHVEENRDGVFMVGDIAPKSFQVKLIYTSVIIMMLAGAAMMLTFNPVLLLFGVLFMVIPWANVLAMKYSDHLYNVIVKKVT